VKGVHLFVKVQDLIEAREIEKCDPGGLHRLALEFRTEMGMYEHGTKSDGGVRQKRKANHCGI